MCKGCAQGKGWEHSSNRKQIGTAGPPGGRNERQARGWDFTLRTTAAWEGHKDHSVIRVKCFRTREQRAPQGDAVWPDAITSPWVSPPRAPPRQAAAPYWQHGPYRAGGEKTPSDAQGTGPWVWGRPSYGGHQGGLPIGRGV